MTAMKLAGFAVMAAVIVLLLRQLRPSLGTAASMVCGALVLMLAMPFLGRLLEGVSHLAEEGGVPQGYLTQLLKITGVSLMMDFAAQTCRDAGENGLALRTELAGRMMLLALALPAMQSLLSQILSIVP